MVHLDDMVELRIPRKPEYVSVARLAVSGIASRMDFSYDEVEDIKLAVGEACTNAIHDTGSAQTSAPIILRCAGEADELFIEVVNPSGGTAASPREEEQPISRLLMEVLMDEVEVTDTEDGSTIVAMVKRVSRDEG